MRQVHPSTIALGFAAAFTLATGCGPFDIDVNVNGTGTGDESTGGGPVAMTTTADSATSALDSGESTGATSAGTSGGSTGEPTEGSTSESTGEPQCYIVGLNGACACDGAPAPTEACEPCAFDNVGTCYCEDTQAPPNWCPTPCVLPHGPAQSWCAAQREVAKVIRCKTSADPQGCYQAVSAQYQVGDWAMVQAGDCDPAIDGPGCVADYAACTAGEPAADCLMLEHDDVAECVALAGGGAAEVVQACVAMRAYYVTGCSQDTQYRSCDPGCGLPCAFGRECQGSAGFEACTSPCQAASDCPSTLYPAPWDAAVCVDGLCIVACAPDAPMECPVVGLTCGPEGECWPYPECTGYINGPCDPGCSIPCRDGLECTAGLCG